ncbi:MAG: tetratricopeptide repeat protein [Acidobacteria bacterium]|nr:tetratricopeptide repeat protein [Acidobacteriota bacterium]
MDFSNSPRVTHAPAAAGAPASRDEDALRRCTLSNSFLKAGDYEGAVEALEGLWRGTCGRPAADGLGARAAAEVLLQAGRLTSALGGARRIEGAQEAAKNLLSEGAGLFERLGDARKVAEARTDLGVCYWREGAFEEARVVLRAALEGLAREDAEQRALALTRLAIVELSAGCNRAAVEVLAEAAPHVEASGSDVIQGNFHSERANAFVALADAGDAEMLDRALVEHAAASFHLEQAGHTRYLANNENNLAILFNRIGRHEEAREHLARARKLHASLKDAVIVAQCDETLARVLVAEGRHEEAERVALSAVRVFEDCDRQALLAEALTTLGVAQARGGRHPEAHQSLARAVEVAEVAGDRTGAGLAALTLTEELGADLDHAELCDAFERAHGPLAGTRDLDTLSRLTACARRALESFISSRGDGEGVEAAPSEERWEGFSLKAEVLRYEAELISRALRDADGVVSRAAKLLGFRHHQTFVALLNNRHKGLLGERRPVIPRRRSLIRRPHRQAQHAGKKG